MRVFIVLIFFVQACSNQDKENQDNFTETPRFEIEDLKGGWQCCEKYVGFKLIEFDDSVYQFQEYEGSGYYGPLFSYSYKKVDDSLIFYSDETWSKPRWLIKSLDSTYMTLISKYDTVICRKVSLAFPLKQYDIYFNRERYQTQFLALKDSFNCL
jgi:hypothetical protein